MLRYMGAIDDNAMIVTSGNIVSFQSSHLVFYV